MCSWIFELKTIPLLSDVKNYYMQKWTWESRLAGMLSLPMIENRISHVFSNKRNSLQRKTRSTEYCFTLPLSLKEESKSGEHIQSAQNEIIWGQRWLKTLDKGSTFAGKTVSSFAESVSTLVQRLDKPHTPSYVLSCQHNPQQPLDNLSTRDSHYVCVLRLHQLLKCIWALTLCSSIASSFCGVRALLTSIGRYF